MAENGLPTALCCPSRQSWAHGQRRRERECSADSWAFSFQLGYFLPFLKVISTANQAGTFFHSFLMVFFSPFTKYFLKASLYNSQSETWLSPAYPYHACFACMLLLLCSSRFFFRRKLIPRVIKIEMKGVFPWSKHFRVTFLLLHSEN